MLAAQKVTMSSLSAADTLIDAGRLVAHARRTNAPEAVLAVSKMSTQQIALARMVFVATWDNQALLFKAMMEGWSAFKIRFELNKLAGKSGK